MGQFRVRDHQHADDSWRGHCSLTSCLGAARGWKGEKSKPKLHASRKKVWVSLPTPKIGFLLVLDKVGHPLNEQVCDLPSQPGKSVPPQLVRHIGLFQWQEAYARERHHIVVWIWLTWVTLEDHSEVALGDFWLMSAQCSCGERSSVKPR